MILTMCLWCCDVVCVSSNGLICCVVSDCSICSSLPSLLPYQPKVLQGLNASWYIDKPGRARGLRCSIPSFTQAETESSACAKAKAMILTVRAVSYGTKMAKSDYSSIISNN